MKSRKPKKIETNDVKKENGISVVHAKTLEESLEIAEKTFYNLIDEYGNQNVLAIVKQMLRTSFLSGELDIVRFHHKEVSERILALFEAELVKIIGTQYDSNLKSHDKADHLGLLVSINRPKFIQHILGQDLPNKMKISLKKAVTTFTDIKLEELETSRKDFEEIYDYAIHNLPVQKSQNNNFEGKTESELEDKQKSIQSADEITKPISDILPEVEQPKSFFDQVSGYTNSFQYLIVPDMPTRLREHKSGKFSTVNDYYKYDIFQSKLKEYMQKRKITELQAIDDILENPVDFAKIDPDFPRILSARKNVILEKQASLTEPE